MFSKERGDHPISMDWQMNHHFCLQIYNLGVMSLISMIIEICDFFLQRTFWSSNSLIWNSLRCWAVNRLHVKVEKGNFNWPYRNSKKHYLIEISWNAFQWVGSVWDHAFWNLSDPNKQFHLMHKTCILGQKTISGSVILQSRIQDKIKLFAK